MSGDGIDDYIRQVRERLEANSATVRTRSIAIGYAFGRNDQRVADGCDTAEDGEAAAFADFFETNTAGQWCDLIDLYAMFRKSRGAAA